MTQDTLLFLYALVILGFFSSRWMVRLAPLMSEVPLKTTLATGLALLAALSGSGLVSLPGTLLLPLSLIAALYIAGPLFLVALARSRNYSLALKLAGTLYWSAEGQKTSGRLLAQVALQQADAERALELLEDHQEGDLLRIQAYALQERWQDLLELAPPDAGDNAFLALGARVWALAELGELDLAEVELERMRRLWNERGQGPLGYRSIALAQARLHAAKADFEAARKQLEEPLPGVPPYLVLSILASAAERAGRLEHAVPLYAQAYTVAPESRRPQLARKLHHYGRSAPQVTAQPARFNFATITLALCLLAAYGVQLWIDGRYGANVASIVAGFLLNIPRVPEPDGIWRFMSYAFVHGGILHIGLNTWVLFDIGRLYESRRNWGNLLTAFVFGTITGAYLTATIQAGDQLVLVGASGGVLGIAGALLADTFNSRQAEDRFLTRALVQWIVIIMIFSLVIPQVSLWGHAGGIVGGLFWGFLRQGLPHAPWLDRIAGMLGIALMAASLIFAAMWFLRHA